MALLLAAGGLFNWWMAADAIKSGNTYFLSRLVYKAEAPRMFRWAVASYKIGAVGAGVGALIATIWAITVRQHQISS